MNQYSAEGSPVMLHVSPSVSDLAGLAGIPSPSASVEDLYAAAGAYTGLGATSRRTAESSARSCRLWRPCSPASFTRWRQHAALA